MEIIAGRKWDIGVDQLRALAEKLRILNAIEIVVGPEEDEIRQLMRRCSVIASASDYEGFGVAAVEGVSAGLFPRLGEIPTFHDLVTRSGVGMLVDFPTLKRLLRRLLTNGERSKLTNQARDNYNHGGVSIRLATGLSSLRGNILQYLQDNKAHYFRCSDFCRSSFASARTARRKV